MFFEGTSLVTWSLYTDVSASPFRSLFSGHPLFEVVLQGKPQGTCTPYFEGSNTTRHTQTGSGTATNFLSDS